MVQYFPSISPDHQEWLLSQPVYFVASAPNRGKHINISPKGLPATSLAILGPNQVAYLDATGSGNETISHVRENGRVTVMFCSFGASPRIMRLFCTGSIVEYTDPAFRGWLSRMNLAKDYIRGVRAVIALDVFLVQTSCGYGVPRLALQTDAATGAVKPYLQDRETLVAWGEKKDGTKELLEAQCKWNLESLDGLPGLRTALQGTGKSNIAISLSIAANRYRRLLELAGAVFVTVLTLWLAGCLKMPPALLDRMASL
ncbi:pyridoxamine phosphate oxidase family protein [Arthroderma uncinatum]|uniref:pyridoxamine phosphate oxidase family protein n=1 Tax=Arthroderma uncinatum TaxID=74035 RepID=UPI00144AED99|nr:pyridoxamine phosphate oxidase family protein [Arthroderma uncinatum]KAF3481459.1 pyridoxamine phosphate oxidase family protein [Arthroderma uncinatum]